MIDEIDLTLVRFGVFSVPGNRLLKTGTCQRALIDQQAGDGEEAREGDFTFSTREPPALDYRMKRQREYPPVGEQLSAIIDVVTAAKKQGLVLPASAEEWLEQCQAVKSAHPKDK